LPINDAKAVTGADVARKDAETRKEETLESHFKLYKDLDQQAASASLLQQLEQHDATVAAILK
jgi:hypothetical protein